MKKRLFIMVAFGLFMCYTQADPVYNNASEVLNGGYKTDSDIQREKALRRIALESYKNTLSGPKIKFSSEEPQEGYVGMTPYQQQHLNDYRASENKSTLKKIMWTVVIAIGCIGLVALIISIFNSNRKNFDEIK